MLLFLYMSELRDSSVEYKKFLSKYGSGWNEVHRKLREQTYWPIFFLNIRNLIAQSGKIDFVKKPTYQIVLKMFLGHSV